MGHQARMRLWLKILLFQALFFAHILCDCVSPLGTVPYRIGEGPKGHAKRMKDSKRWQDINSLDYLAPAGTPVHAVIAGTVCDPAKDKECVFGKTIQEMKDKFSLSSFYLDGRDGKRYYYTHLQSIAVKAGQQVKQGQVVGAIGAYNGKNAHLHLATKQGSPCDVLEACRPVDTRDCK
eukprot:GHRR01010185.1.p1 GENE.GHRR01010185.1~~GHRR01010185.1.p1  ORF type:complete len:178 (+),score=43.01 GHRR01010185.1:150-683(+)